MHPRSETRIVLAEGEQLESNNDHFSFKGFSVLSARSPVEKITCETSPFLNLYLCLSGHCHCLRPQLKKECMRPYRVKEQVGRDSGPSDGSTFQHPSVHALIWHNNDFCMIKRNIKGQQPFANILTLVLV